MISRSRAPHIGPRAAIEDTTERDTGRLMGFSDGVFAFAITLLVLNLLGLKLPSPDTVRAAALAATLARAWPAFVTYLISFATILVMWVYHHRLLQSVRRAETLLLFSNGFLLLLVTAVPFPTLLVGTYLTTPAAPVASAVYAGYFALVDIAFDLLWLVVLRQKARYLGREPRIAPSMLIALLGFPCYLIAAAVAFWSPLLTLLICGALWIAWAATAHRLRGELLTAARTSRRP